MDYVAYRKYYARFCAGLRPYVEEQMRLYAAKDGSSLALRNELGGPLTVERTPEQSRDERIYSTALFQLLHWWRAGTGRIPACYADGPDAILMARSTEDLDEGMSEEEFLRRFQPLAVEELRCQSVELTQEGVRFNGFFPTRSEVSRWGDALAFQRCNDGVVIARKTENGKLLQTPEVVDFVRTHWNGKPLFRREVDGAVVFSPDPLRLAGYRSLARFRALNKEKLRKRMWVDLGRMFTLDGAPEIAEVIGDRASVCCYGKYMGLLADKNGDVALEKTGAGVRIASRQLCMQLMTYFKAGEERLYLVPHGNMLLFSNSAAEDGEEYPPQEYFCRLLMAPIQSCRLMKYSVNRKEVLERQRA